MEHWYHSEVTGWLSEKHKCWDKVGSTSKNKLQNRGIHAHSCTMGNQGKLEGNLKICIVGLHVTSWQPCWWCVGDQEQNHFSPLGTKPYFHVHSLRKNYIVLTTNTPPTWLPCHMVASQELEFKAS